MKDADKVAVQVCSGKPCAGVPADMPARPRRAPAVANGPNAANYRPGAGTAAALARRAAQSPQADHAQHQPERTHRGVGGPAAAAPRR